MIGSFHKKRLSSQQTFPLNCLQQEKRQSKNSSCRQHILKNFYSSVLKLKIKMQMGKIISHLTSRMQKKLRQEHYNLINDKSNALTFDYNQFSLQKANLKKFQILPNNNNNINSPDLLNKNLQIHQDNEKRSNGIKILESVLNRLPVFNPSNNLILLWDIVFIFFVIVYFFYVPISLIFNMNYVDLLPHSLVYIKPVIVFIEIVISLNSGFFLSGLYIEDRIMIIKNWSRGVLTQDLIAGLSITIDILYNIESSSYNNNGNKNQEFCLICILKLLYFFYLPKIIQKLNKIQQIFIIQKFSHNLMRLLKLVLFLIFLGHIFALLFLFMGICDNNQGNNNWIREKQISEEAWNIQYLYAYYFTIVTMGTVGYGDIVPISKSEKILVIILILISNGVFGYSLNCINQIFKEIHLRNNELKNNIFTINRYMKKKTIPVSLQNQIREYLNFILKESIQDTSDEQKILNMLSESLREKLLVQANKIVLIDSPVFKDNFSPEIINKTVQLIKEQKCSPEQIICESGLDDKKIYFIEQGSVEIYLPKQGGQQLQTKEVEQILQTLPQGSSFGSYSFFTGKPKNFNIRSSGFATLLFISRDEFVNLLKSYPYDYERFCYMRDNIMQYRNYEQIYCSCLLCKSHEHMIDNCPQIHYAPNRNYMVSKLNVSFKQERKSDKGQRHTGHIHTLKQMTYNTERLEQFQEKNDYYLDQFEQDNSFNQQDCNDYLSSQSSSDSLSSEEDEDQEESMVNETSQKKEFQVIQEQDEISEEDTKSEKENSEIASPLYQLYSNNFLQEVKSPTTSTPQVSQKQIQGILNRRLSQKGSDWLGSEQFQQLQTSSSSSLSNIIQSNPPKIKKKNSLLQIKQKNLQKIMRRSSLNQQIAGSSNMLPQKTQKRNSLIINSLNQLKDLGIINFPNSQSSSSTFKNNMDSSSLSNKKKHLAVLFKQKSLQDQQTKRRNSIITSLLHSDQLKSQNYIQTKEMQELLYLQKQSLKPEIMTYLKAVYDNFDQMKSYTIYFVHNNVENVLQQYQSSRLKLNKKKNKKSLRYTKKYGPGLQRQSQVVQHSTNMKRASQATLQTKERNPSVDTQKGDNLENTNNITSEELILTSKATQRQLIFNN